MNECSVLEQRAALLWHPGRDLHIEGEAVLYVLCTHLLSKVTLIIVTFDSIAMKLTWA